MRPRAGIASSDCFLSQWTAPQESASSELINVETATQGRTCHISSPSCERPSEATPPFLVEETPSAIRAMTPRLCHDPPARS